MNTDKLLELARLQIGLKEKTGQNDGEIEKFTGGRKEPYCAHFIAWLFRTIGSPLPDDKVPSLSQHNPLASVAYLKKVFESREWMVAKPEQGAVVFFSVRGQSDSGSGRHVGLIDAVESDCFYTIEANYSNSVKRVKRYKNDKTLWGFGKVKDGFNITD